MHFWSNLANHPSIGTVVLVQRYLQPTYDATLLEQMEEVIQALRRAGKQVVLVGPVPEAAIHVPFAAARRLAQAALLRKSPGHAAVRCRDGRYPGQGGADGEGPRRGGVRAARGALRRGGLPLTLDGRPAYFDDHHLTLTTWRELAPLFLPYLLDGDGPLAKDPAISGQAGTAGPAETAR